MHICRQTRLTKRVNYVRFFNFFKLVDTLTRENEFLLSRLICPYDVEVIFSFIINDLNSLLLHFSKISTDDQILYRPLKKTYQVDDVVTEKIPSS